MSDELRDTLLAHDGLPIGGHMNMLCPFTERGDCDDRPKNGMRGRFYVSTDDGLYKYFCHKCNRGGYVNDYILHLIGVSPNDRSKLLQVLNEDRKDVGFEFSYSSSDRIRNVFILPTTAKAEVLKYFKGRMGINLSREIAFKFKIIANVEEFIDRNRNKLGYDVCKDLSKFSKHSIGFLSKDDSHIILRDMREDTHSDKKYLSIKIHNKKDADKLYQISENNYRTPELDVIMVEGQFDIIGMYIHISRNADKWSKNDKEFVGVGGIRYHSVINKLINYGEIRPINLYIIKDAGVPDKVIQNKIKFNTPLDAYMYLENLSGKDTGDPVKDGDPEFKQEYIRIHRKKKGGRY